MWPLPHVGMKSRSTLTQECEDALFRVQPPFAVNLRCSMALQGTMMHNHVLCLGWSHCLCYMQLWSLPLWTYLWICLEWFDNALAQTKPPDVLDLVLPIAACLTLLPSLHQMVAHEHDWLDLRWSCFFIPLCHDYHKFLFVLVSCQMRLCHSHDQSSWWTDARHWLCIWVIFYNSTIGWWHLIDPFLPSAFILLCCLMLLLMFRFLAFHSIHGSELYKWVLDIVMFLLFFFLLDEWFAVSSLHWTPCIGFFGCALPYLEFAHSCWFHGVCQIGSNSKSLLFGLYSWFLMFFVPSCGCVISMVSFDLFLGFLSLSLLSLVANLASLLCVFVIGEQCLFEGECWNMGVEPTIIPIIFFPVCFESFTVEQLSCKYWIPDMGVLSRKGMNSFALWKICSAIMQLVWLKRPSLLNTGKTKGATYYWTLFLPPASKSCVFGWSYLLFIFFLPR